MTMSENKDVEMMRKLQGWLVEEGFLLRKEDNPQANFQYAVTSPVGINLVVLQQLGKKDQIVVAGVVNIEDQVQKKILELSDSERGDFLWDLRFSLLLSHFQFQFQPQGADVMQQIMIVDPMWYDGITKDTFMKSLSTVTNGVLLVLWKIVRKFGGQLPKQESAYVR
jgi:hypothetical protein